jgi:ABC-2 type transport system ATP-binding protein
MSGTGRAALPAPATDQDDAAVIAHDLRKTFRTKAATVEAVSGLDLRVGRGEIFGFLGPNGAGKTTTLRMLTTLLPIDGGEALIAGIDVARRPGEVRRRIGYVGQRGGADLPATGREDLILQARLHGASAAEAARRADELIHRLELAEFADRIARTYSGGQRRRLEVALGIVHRPDVLFLDEPTTGLDPQNRANLWDQVRALRAEGTTIFLTTHYLEEADALADRLAIVDHGRVVAEGSPTELKARLGRTTMALEPDLPDERLESFRRDLERRPSVRAATADGRIIRLEVGDAVAALASVVGAAGSLGVGLRTLDLAQPSLDDVFLQQTGRSLRDGDGATRGVRS